MKDFFTRARIKKYLIIIATMIVLGFVWHYIAKEKPWELKLAPIEKDRPDIVMKTIKASQVSGKRTYWEIDSDKAVIRGNNVLFLTVTGNLFNEKGQVTFKFQSPEVEMKSTRTIFKSISGKTPDGTRIITSRAYWLENSRYLSSPHPVQLFRDQFDLQGNKMYFFPEQNKTLLTDGVVLIEAQGRVTVNSETCELYSKKSYFRQDVKIDYGDLKVFADVLEVSRADKKMTIPVNPTMNYKGNLITADTFYTILGSSRSFLSGNVTVKKDDTLIKADQAVMDNQKKMLELTGNINGSQEQTSISGEKALYDPETKRITIEGRARLIKVKQNE